MPHIFIVTQFMACSVNNLYNYEKKYGGDKIDLYKYPYAPCTVYL